MKYYNEFIDYITYEKKYSQNTIINYKRIIEEYFAFLNKEGILPLEVDTKVIRNYLRELYEKKYSKKSMCLYISALRSFYKYFLRKRLIKNNPMLLIKNPKLDRNTPKFLYSNELSLLYDAIDINTILGIRDKLILELLYSTGVRVSELVNIKLDDINYYDYSIRILGKGSKERNVLFGEQLYDLLELYLNHSRGLLIKGDTDILLLNKNGTPLTDRGVRLIINNMALKTTLKEHISPHTIRHTFATHLLKGGADLKTVQELLGHSSLSATQVYTHVTNELLRKVYLECHPRAKKE